MAGATTLGDLVSAIGARTEDSAVIAELKAGSEEAYSWLIGEFHQPIYSLIYRMVNDPSDAADTTQEVFLKVFRGMKHRPARGGESETLVVPAQGTGNTD
jgi:RNA polymerase sigma-70 factor (ECF subfamily)